MLEQWVHFIVLCLMPKLSGSPEPWVQAHWIRIACLFSVWVLSFASKNKRRKNVVFESIVIISSPFIHYNVNLKVYANTLIYLVLILLDKGSMLLVHFFCCFMFQHFYGLVSWVPLLWLQKISRLADGVRHVAKG